MLSSYTEFEIHLIDNNSRQEDFDLIYHKFEGEQKVSLYRNETNLGFCKAHLEIYSKYLKSENYPYILLLNNDTIVLPDTIQNLMNFAHVNEADLAACQMIQYYSREKIDNIGHRILNTGEILPKNHNTITTEEKLEILNIGPSGGAALYNTTMLRKIGFFDPYFDTGYEDAEFGLRAISYGYKSLLCKEAIVYHKGGKSITKIFNLDYAIRIQEAILYTMFKLFPLGLIIKTLVIRTIRNFFIILSSLLFFKIEPIKVVLLSPIKFYSKSFLKAIAARKQHTKMNRNLISEYIESSFKRDLIGFKNYFIKKEDSNIETYRKK